MASFHGKIGWKGQKNRENKNYRYVSFHPDGQEKIPKKQQKNSKIEKHHDGFIPRKNRLKNANKERKQKIIAPFRSFPTGKREFQKNRKKIEKLKNTITAAFQGKIGWKTLREGENKNYRYVSFLPDVEEKIPKKQKKN